MNQDQTIKDLTRRLKQVGATFERIRVRVLSFPEITKAKAYFLDVYGLQATVPQWRRATKSIPGVHEGGYVANRVTV